MVDPDPLHLLGPDGVTAVGIGVSSSMVAGLLERVPGWTLFVTSVGAALLTGVVLPVAINRGYGWGDWLGAVCVLCGLFAGLLFGLANMIKRRWLSRGDEMADGFWTLTIGRFFVKKDGTK